MTSYTIYISPDALSNIKDLPGNIRQRVRRAINDLATNPRPSDSKNLMLANSMLPTITNDEAGSTAESTWLLEVRRLRIDRWRIVYLVHDADMLIDIVAVRKRPPYDYGDLAQLLTEQ